MNEDKKIPKRTAILIMILIGIIAFLAGSSFFSGDYFEFEDDPSQTSNTDDCNVLAISINGYLSTYAFTSDEEDENVSSSEDIVDGIMLAEEDPEIKAVMVLIDSSGGDGVAGEETANALKTLSKPSVAVIRAIGASSAYWASTGTDKIYASKISDVGSIGITSSYLDQSSKDIKDGYKYIELSSAKHKNLGNPSRPITAEEKAIVLADLKKAHDVFVEEVATNRNLKIADVAKLANGLTFIGIDALKYGLIDEIGDIITATKYIEEQIGEKAEICWY
ncbi:MAG: S49 family peptidase [Candidatus Paceibacterota bacterium]